ncbi:30S ribosomal protein S10 [Candidatus Kaiserbacteria bacterium CG10_big_fil_rev_8_21_14_0_10_45_20]|uniref:Small ribosomal subunit protein uS10 n=1 Tax=Candidatus Kaiserbacteria bacterium CG10_big_fil_rev_8_21_14_0_10_45_20 TaxID=1974607 RepID=A0A2H0UHK5_9BACT|nr:MAG: 30S ribosomal protein S10 [Candidatus Kaiserbacteria bacterium CG10_big_fil_rev_8_21_14_0_10_45_20]
MVEKKKKTASPRETPTPEATSKLRLRIRGYDHKLVDSSVKQIIDTALRFEAQVVGPVPLPTDIKKFTVNRSPFIDKDSREQFEMRTHKRILDIVNPNPKIVDALTNISLPSGVSVDVKMT